jgi:hypothetical protein
LILPLWLAAVIVALLVAFGLVLLGRAGGNGFVEQWARVGLMLVALAAAWIIVAPGSGDRLAAQRRSLDARLNEIVTRASAPGSALACLDGAAGEIVEAACEKALFATPQATAAAVSYVSAQLSLLAEASDYERRSRASYQPALAGVRLAVETDRFGIAAHVLEAREGCTPDHCDFLARLQTPSQVSENLRAHKYELVVAQHAPEWPQNELPAAAAAAAPATVASAAPATKPNNLFFPSSASIPPISIMTPEPTGPAPAAAGEPAPKQPAASARKPAAAVPPSRRPPTAGNAVGAGGTAPAASSSAPATPNASGHPAPGQPSDN